MAIDTGFEQRRLLYEHFLAAVAVEDAAREAMRDSPNDKALFDVWLHAMDATNEASRALRERTSHEASFLKAVSPSFERSARSSPR